MSREIALDNIHLRPADRWGHTEYSLEYHTEYLARRSGLLPDDPQFLRRAYDALRFDFIWHTNDGLIDWEQAGRSTDMGHAEYAAQGADRRQPRSCPFEDPEEVWAFDAVSEYGLPDFEEQVRAYQAFLTERRTTHPNQLFTGGYYRTIVSGAIQAFGWDMLLLGASNMDRMEKVFDSFFRRTLFHMQAWARTDAEVLIQHDDFVWSAGPFMHPDIYRRVIIPRYAELWRPVHEAGKKLLFCSDGDFTEFVDDLAEAGADGFIFEPMVDFGMMVDRFGSSHCLIGSFVDCRDLTFGKWDSVQRSLARTFERLADCAGVILACGNHLPANIPREMLDRYFDYLLPRLPRNGDR